MIWKPILTLAFLAMAVPHEPNIGMGKPATFALPQLALAHSALLAALERVRADLKANGARR
jgi:hypothetical protein